MKTLVFHEPDAVAAWAMRLMDGDWQPGRGTAIGLKEDGELIAAAVYDSYNGRSLCMHVAALPGRFWCTRDFRYYCFAYPFYQLKVSKILGMVASTNLAARRFDENLGFVLEATLKDAHPGGDLLIYSMTKDQCRWLKQPLRMEHGKAQGTAGT